MIKPNADLISLFGLDDFDALRLSAVGEDADRRAVPVHVLVRIASLSNSADLLMIRTARARSDDALWGEFIAQRIEGRAKTCPADLAYWAVVGKPEVGRR